MTTTDPAELFDLAPELRMASYAYREEFGQPAAMIGRVPGQVTLLASGPLQLTVAAPWGVIAAAGPRDDDIIELTRMQRPGERERVTVRDATAGSCPPGGSCPPRERAAVRLSRRPPSAVARAAGTILNARSNTKARSQS